MATAANKPAGRRERPARGPSKAEAMARQVQEAIRPGQSIALLKELHILTRDGALNQDSRRKLKQVYHLFGFIEKILLELEAAGRSNITLADHGAGKSYLGFIIYDLFFRQRAEGTIFGIETREELVQRSRALAQQLGFDRMQFLPLTVAESAHSADLPQRIDVVTALHACDTATDDAIAFGLQKQAGHMVLVPCCQAETAGFLRQNKAFNLSRTPPGRAVAPSAAYARNGQPDHQCAALPVSGVARLQRYRDRTGGLGAQPEERVDSGASYRPEKAQRDRAHAGHGCRIRLAGAAGTALSAGGCLNGPCRAAEAASWQLGNNAYTQVLCGRPEWLQA